MMKNSKVLLFTFITVIGKCKQVTWPKLEVAKLSNIFKPSPDLNNM